MVIGITSGASILNAAGVKRETEPQTVCGGFNMPQTLNRLLAYDYL